MDVPSLGHIALVKVTNTLWNTFDDMIDYWPESVDHFDQLSPVMEEIIMKNVSRLELPTSLQQKIKNIIEPIVNHIEVWNDFYGSIVNSEVGLKLQNFFWTSDGTLDETRTIQGLIKNRNLKIKTRYELACHYCLENDVRQLWNELTQREKKLYSSKSNVRRRIDKQTLVTFWTYYINGQLSQLNKLVKRMTRREFTVYQYAFEQAVVARNIVATKYFLEQLSPGQREISLKRAVEILVEMVGKLCRYFSSGRFSPKNYYNEILCFLFLKMDKEQQIEIMNEGESCDILKGFLDWPRQRSFMNVARLMLPYLSEEEFQELLLEIILKLDNDWKDHDYLKLFGMFWREGSAVLRESATIDIHNTALPNLFQVSSKNIRLILGEMNLEGIKDFIFNDHENLFFEDCALADDWRPMEIIIQLCKSRRIASKDELKEFRDKLKEFIEWTYLDNENYERRSETEKFFKTIDVLFEAK